MNKEIYFITGTDTNVGKTVFAAEFLQQQQNRTIGLKPIASGADYKNGELVNSDAALLQGAASIKLPMRTVNPFCYEAPIAPHIASANQKPSISLIALNDWYSKVQQLDFDLAIIEGAGGWLLPLNETETLADFIVLQNIPIILVVGMRLGCLNHALLSYQSIISMGGVFAGWVPNILEPDMPYLDENIAHIESVIPQKLGHLAPQMQLCMDSAHI